MEGDALRDAARQLSAELRAKMERTQGGVGTVADLVWTAFIAHLDRCDGVVPEEDSHALRHLQLLLARRAQGRFVEYATRVKATGAHGPSDVDYFTMVASQGAFDCLQWKGMPLFKTVYDFSLYPMMLWAIRPHTIVELGSGSGASAIWLADLTTMFGFESHVRSVDLRVPAVRHERVSFVEGDCEAIQTVFDAGFLETATHPWMLIEDAHVNVYGVLRHFHPYLEPGDYVVIEDSAGKEEEIGHFLQREPNCYKVDTYYTDFFGRNATCAQDSIFVRV